MAFPASITEHFTNELGLEVHVFVSSCRGRGRLIAVSLRLARAT